MHWKTFTSLRMKIARMSQLEENNRTAGTLPRKLVGVWSNLRLSTLKLLKSNKGGLVSLDKSVCL
jgi:hypothetical protein